MMLRSAGLGLVGGALLLSAPAAADTIYLQDGSELKGVIVEEFADRLTLSTEEGERQVLAGQIARVVYDTPEQNYLRLGDRAFDRGSYDEAVQQYQRALTANPKSEEARRRLVAAQAADQRRRDEAVRARVAQEQAVALWSRGQSAPSADAASSPPSQRLLDRLGLSLEARGDEAWVSRVASRGPAQEAGLQAGDRIVAVWGRLTKYEPLEAIIQRLAEGPDHSEVQVMLERDVEVGRRQASLTFGLRDEGLVVEQVGTGGAAAAAGVRAGDLIVALDGQATRYLPVAEAQRAMAQGAEPTVRLTLRRGTAMWRRPLARRGAAR